MEVNEIIERLKQHETEMIFTRNVLMPEDYLKNREALREGINLIKKHIPVEILTNDLDSPLCPSCKKMFYTLYHPYCSNCGQAIDWKNFETEKKRKAMMHLVGH